MIATSSKIDVSGVNVPEHVNDEYFRKAAKPHHVKSQEGMVSQPAKEVSISRIFALGQPVSRRRQTKEGRSLCRRCGCGSDAAVLCVQAKVLPEERKADQKRVDEPILAVTKGMPLMKEYLSARFTLSKGQFPHELRF